MMMMLMLLLLLMLFIVVVVAVVAVVIVVVREVKSSLYNQASEEWFKKCRLRHFWRGLHCIPSE